MDNSREGKMVYSYCTLFDKNYLDRGLALVESIRKYNTNSNIYVLAMDDMCYKILDAICMPKMVLVNLAEIETEDLLKVKRTRSRGEYCWTCTASLIYFVLTKYREEYCTYIDADVYFFDDPDQLVDEMIQEGKSVQIIEHRFRNGFAGRVQEELSGRFCVEFNTFKNDEFGIKVLDTWRKQTIEKCSFSDGEKHFGDQMYLEDWLEKYDCVNVLQNLGAGLGPWNVNRYRLLKKRLGEEFWVTYDKGTIPIKVIFFHYHDLQYITKEKVNINIHKRYWKLNMELTYILYREYIKKLQEKKEWLEKTYGFYPLVPEDAVTVIHEAKLWERFKRLLTGNIYRNIRFRIENHLKIFIFGKYDIMNIE